MKLYRKVPFHKFAGHYFDREKLAEELLSDAPPFDKPLTIVFDKKKSINLDDFRLNARVEDPSYDFSKRVIEDYTSKRKIEGISHLSNSHALRVYPDGEMYFDYMVNDRLLYKTGEVYLGVLENPRKMEEQIKKWSTIARKLGFKTSLPETIPVVKENRCEAIKLCTELKKLKQDEITAYTTNTLLKEVSGDSKLLIDCGIVRKIVVDAKSINLNLYHPFLDNRPYGKEEVNFAINMMGKVEKEPHVKSRVEVSPIEFLSKYKESLKSVGSLLSFPIAGGVIGTIIGYCYGSPFECGLIGLGAGGGVVGAWIGGELFGSWLEERERRKEEEERRAERMLIDFARKQEHLKPPYGVCAVITTETCKRKLGKKESSS